MYLLETGPHEQQMIKNAMASGQPMPEVIANKPELRLGLELYLDAFFDLDSERQIGLSVSSISQLAVKRYAQAFEFDDEQTNDLAFFVREMDSVYMKWLDSKRPKTGKGK